LAAVLADPLYRVFFVMLLVLGFGSGGAFSFVSLWAAQVLGADAVQVGLVRTVAGLIAVVVGVALGYASDRSRRRVPWIVGGMAVSALGWLGVAAARDYVLGVAAYTLTSIGNYTLVFALLGDWLRHRRDPDATIVNSNVRLAFALGWVAGPAAAGLVVGAVGYAPLFLGTAALQATAVVLALRLRDVPPTPAVVDPPPAADGAPTARPASGPPPSARPERTAVAALWLYVAASFLSSAASPSRFVLMPLYLTEALHVSVTLVGLLFTVSVVYELPLFPLVARWAERHGYARVLGAGFAAYAVYFAALALSPGYWPILLLESLFAFVVATTNGVGMLHVQHLAPARAGTAIGLYGAASQLGAVATAPLLGYLATRAGWPAAFTTSALIAVASVGAFLLSLRAMPRRA
jgi:SET family sugar efflux transporter-like MFS transporter